MSQDIAPKPRVSRGIFYLCVIGLVIVGIAGFIFSQRSEGSGVNIDYGAPDPLPVNVMPVSYEETLDFGEQYTGLVSARRSTSLGFEASGRIIKMAVDVGDQVKAGQTLGELDTRTLKANLAAAKAQIGEAEASLKLAQATVERQAVLEEKGLLSSQRYDEASAQSDAARARLAAAKAQADALVVRIELSTLTAPFGGVITRRQADEGAIASPGQPVLQLVEVEALEASIGLPQAVAARLTEGDIYPLRTSQGSFEASLRTLTGVIESSQRTITAVFDIVNPELVAPGEVVRLELAQSLPVRGFWIPVSAMTEADRGLWAVYIVRDNAAGHPHIEKRLVDIIHAEANRAFVRGAVEEGELFLKDGLHRVAPNQLVAPTLVADEGL